ncbi:MAG: HAMP domain-containing sensor histidine kinase, partial [Pseudomonadota bacterium]
LERNRRLEYLEFRAKEHYYAQVKVMAEEAELSVRRKNALLNVLGHVVKTPLHQIIGYAQIIEQSEALPPEEEQISSFAEEIRRAGQALSYQSQRILDYSRAEADLIGSQFHDSNAARMVREAIYRHEDSIREKHINVKIGCGETPIRVDTRHVIRALDELIDNAVRYCPPGSNILITTEETVGGLALTIADDGPGIAEGDINRVGDALNQTEEFRNMGGDKLGIGVSLAHILLKLGGGKLHFCSIPDIGTVARVIFPRTTKPPKENGTATRSTQKVA